MDGTFLPDSPAILIKSGRYNKVEVMIGWTKEDGNIISAGRNSFLLNNKLMAYLVAE